MTVTAHTSAKGKDYVLRHLHSVTACWLATELARAACLLAEASTACSKWILAPSMSFADETSATVTRPGAGTGGNPRASTLQS